MAEDPQFGPLRQLREYNIVDERELADPAGRVLIAKRQHAFIETIVLVVRWDNEAPRFFECRVDVDDDDIDLVETSLRPA